MNRELKFRIWDKQNKIFIYERGASHKRLAISLVGLVYHGGYDDVLSENDYVIQQFTGLKDKNGKEIHEGDIVEAVHFVFDFKYKDNKRPENYSGIIKWHRSYWAIGDYKLFVMEDDSLSVIGNIFETPELLK